MKRTKETPRRKVTKKQKRLRHEPSPPPSDSIEAKFEQFKALHLQTMQESFANFASLIQASKNPSPPKNPSPIHFAQPSVTNINAAPVSQNSVTNIDVAENPVSQNSVTNIDLAENPVNDIYQPSSSRATDNNINVGPTYSTLDDLAQESSDESFNDESPPRRSATPPTSRYGRPAASKNYYETPVSPTEMTGSAAYSPTSPSLLEYKKKEAKLHKNRLTKAQISNLALNVNSNHIFVQGRAAGFRRLKRKKQRQTFKTPCKSELIKNWYKRVFPDLYHDWGNDFEKICPITPADVNEWIQNMFQYGSVDGGDDNHNLPGPPSATEMDKNGSE